MSSQDGPPSMPEPQVPTPDSSRSLTSGSGPEKDRSLKFWHKKDSDSPPAYAPPPSGFRIPLSASTPFPPSTRAGHPPCTDLNPRFPVFIGSAILDRSVHPCKVAPHLSNPCRVPHGGAELEHTGRYDLLPFDPATMEFVRASYGRVPDGRRPVDGGYEEAGAKLYHAIGVVEGVRVPGKTAEHLVRGPMLHECVGSDAWSSDRMAATSLSVAESIPRTTTRSCQCLTFTCLSTS